MNKLLYYLSSKDRFLERVLYTFSPFIKNDRKYIELKWKTKGMGYKLDLDNPITFNEKLNWLKLHDRKAIYSRMADKYEAKKIVAKIIGEEYVVPCYGVWNSVDEIDYNTLPNKFILKCTHDSGSRIICRDKKRLNISDANLSLSKALSHTYYLGGREWIYKDIKPRVLAEKFLDDHSGTELRDYKFWCFNGEPKVVYCTNKGDNIFENFYDMDFKVLNINHGFERHVPEFVAPSGFEEMKTLAAKLSKDIPFVRVDFFQVEDKVYFGEFTFYDWGGLRAFSDYKTDLDLGKIIKLP